MRCLFYYFGSLDAGLSLLEPLEHVLIFMVYVLYLLHARLDVQAVAVVMAATTSYVLVVPRTGVRSLTSQLNR